MKRVIVLALATLMALTLLVSCGKSEGGLLGYWKGEVDSSDAILEFKANGDGKVYYISDEGSFYLPFEWKEKGDGKLEMTLMDETEDVEYKLDGDTLTFEGEELKRASKSDVPDDAVDFSSLAALAGEE